MMKRATTDEAGAMAWDCSNMLSGCCDTNEALADWLVAAVQICAMCIQFVVCLHYYTHIKTWGSNDCILRTWIYLFHRHHRTRKQPERLECMIYRIMYQSHVHRKQPYTMPNQKWFIVKMNLRNVVAVVGQSSIKRILTILRLMFCINCERCRLSKLMRADENRWEFHEFSCITIDCVDSCVSLIFGGFWLMGKWQTTRAQNLSYTCFVAFHHRDRGKSMCISERNHLRYVSGNSIVERGDWRQKWLHWIPWPLFRYCISWQRSKYHNCVTDSNEEDFSCISLSPSSTHT